MKKLALILAMVLLLSLSACGAPAPAATESPVPDQTAAPSPTAAPATAAQEGMVMLLTRGGGTAAADLDGDGAQDSVTLETEGQYGEFASLTVNGRKYLSADLEALGYYAMNLASEYFAVVDIDGGDGKLEIALMDYGPSDDLTTEFFRYENGELSYIGYLDGFIYNARGGTNPVTFNGDGTGSRQIRYGVLQTWFGSTGWKYTEGEGFSEIEPELYEVYYSGVTAIADVAAYAEMSESAERSVLPAGTELELTGTDNDQWVRVFVHTGEYDGYTAWLHLDAEYGQKVETASGYEMSGKALSGLLFAD